MSNEMTIVLNRRIEGYKSWVYKALGLCRRSDGVTRSSRLSDENFRQLVEMLRTDSIEFKILKGNGENS